MIYRVIAMVNGKPKAISGVFNLVSAAETYMKMAEAQGYKGVNIQPAVPKRRGK